MAVNSIPFLGDIGSGLTSDGVVNVLLFFAVVNVILLFLVGGKQPPGKSSYSRQALVVLLLMLVSAYSVWIAWTANNDITHPGGPSRSLQLLWGSIYLGVALVSLWLPVSLAVESFQERRLRPPEAD